MAAVTLTNPASRKPLRVALWCAQILLAAAFGMAGYTHLTVPMARLAEMYPWTADASVSLVRFIGTVEMLGAIGLVVPAATRIAPRLTPLAAVGLLVIMVLASLLHTSRGEYQALPITLGLAALAAFVAWGRAWAAPIAPRV
jgi:uncharacterized membrane protein YphA (DoxX/SURF4 family)